MAMAAGGCLAFRELFGGDAREAKEQVKTGAGHNGTEWCFTRQKKNTQTMRPSPFHVASFVAHRVVENVSLHWYSPRIHVFESRLVSFRSKLLLSRAATPLESKYSDKVGGVMEGGERDRRVEAEAKRPRHERGRDEKELRVRSLKRAKRRLLSTLASLSRRRRRAAVPFHLPHAGENILFSNSSPGCLLFSVPVRCDAMERHGAVRHGMAWQLSAARFFVDVLPLLEGVPVISARSLFESQFPGSPLCWKVRFPFRSDHFFYHPCALARAPDMHAEAASCWLVPLAGEQGTGWS